MNDLIHFLGILSINLAVINFLPIPPLDGGQMVFLMAEKIRGRPLPESAAGRGDRGWPGAGRLPDDLRPFPGRSLEHRELERSLSDRHEPSEVPHGITLGATE